MAQLEKCVCGAEFAAIDGPLHKYAGATAACWKVYGDVLAREYENRDYWAVHRLTVDTYAVQHAVNDDRRNIQSVNIHLMALYLIIEENWAFEKIPPVLDRVTKLFKNDFQYLTPPGSLGEITVKDIADADSAKEHTDLVWQWARSVWAAWSPHHGTIEDLSAKMLK